ncbi:D-alanyl-D-alanine carboxypeptidase family protein [Novosphingobium sp. 9]|uniref:D-alanyl-D-alanine carboxypeptidase family protein n=1 Tax=Novosphingobium sp. 9 TaxID=2025349 RepID=UPI0021B50FF3|nr:D-alanyl-D-alanine carboxypeptidase family protein [Novosphingobium sp. 9]
MKFASALALAGGVVATGAATAANTATTVRTVSLPAPPPELAKVPVSILVDLGSGQVLEQRRPDVSWLPASVTKVMTAYTAFQEIDAGRLKLDRRFPVPKAISDEWFAKGTSMYLKPTDNPTTADLLHGILTQSANDAAILLATEYAGSVPAWTAKMNANARALGMAHSHYNTPNGWMDEGNTYVAARDMVKLADAMIMHHPELYHEFVGKKHWFWRDVAMRSHDPLVDVFPGADGIKTGYTREAGYNYVGTAERDGRRLVLVLAASATPKIRDDAAKALMEWGFSGWQAHHLFDKGATITAARVQNGAQRTVPLVADREVHATVLTGTDPKITLTAHYDGPLRAPITRGQKVGDLEIRVGNLPAGHIALYAREDVPVAGPVDRIVNGFMNLFS